MLCLTSQRDPSVVGKPHMAIHCPPPPCAPVSIEQLLATQNELMSVFVQNEACHGARCPQHPYRTLLKNWSIATVKYGCNRVRFVAIPSNTTNVTLVEIGGK
jgi:hypothetical protein